MLDRILLCTFCHGVIAGPPIENAQSDAAFCSVRCRDLDAARLARTSPGAAPERRVLVAIVHNLSVVPRAVTQSLIALGWGNRVQRAKDAHGIAAIDMAWFTASPRIDDLRNVALQQALADGFSHVLFLDADMLHPDDLFERILRHVDREAVVSGFYTLKTYPFSPVAFRDGRLHESGRFSTYRYDEAYAEVDADGLRDEEIVGMGCTLIPLSIVRALGPRPWFEYKTDADGWHQVSEDMPFCEKVRAAGFRIALDPSIKCGHLYTEFATEEHWKRAKEVLAHTQQQLATAVALNVGVEDTAAPGEEAVPEAAAVGGG